MTKFQIWLYILTWLAWELPNYGPGPDFDRGTIYRQDSDDWAGYKGPDYHVEDDLEDVNYDSPAVDYPPQPTTTKGPVTGPSPPIVPPVLSKSPIPSQSTFPTQAVITGPITGPRAGHSQAQEGPILNEHEPQTSSSQMFARQPHHPALDLKLGQHPPVRGGHSGRSRSRGQPKKGSNNSSPSQHRPNYLSIAPGQNDSYSKAKWRKGFSPDGKLSHINVKSIINSQIASYRLPYECQVFQAK